MKNSVLGHILIALLVISSSAVHGQDELPEKVVRGKSMTSVELLWLLTQIDLEKYSGVSFVECNFFQGSKEEIALGLFAPYSELNASNEKSNPLTKLKLIFPVKFTKCEFNGNENRAVFFTGLFLQNWEFNFCKGYGIQFGDCVFYSKPKFFDCSFKYLNFSNDHFFEQLYFNDNVIEQLDIESCAFIRNPKSSTFGIWFDNRNKFDYLNINQSEFIDASEKAVDYKKFDQLIHDDGIVTFNDFLSTQLKITNCYFDCTLKLAGFIVESEFDFSNNRLLREVVIESMPSLPEESSQIPYTQFQYRKKTRKNENENGSLKNKIGIAISLNGGENQFIRYNQDSDFIKDINKPWANRDPEKRIIPVYSRLLAIYDANNDIESYNQCFNDLKEIEKTASKVRYETYHRFQDWFRWRMDDFLQRYSAYGTDPVLSLINGFWTIVLFACLYAIFPSEQDNLALHRIRSAFRKYIAHFGKGEKSFFSPDEIYQAELAKILAWRNDINLYRNQMPPVIRAFAEPIHWVTSFVALVKHRARQLFYFNVYDDWQSLSKKRKISTTAILTASLLLFALWGLFMRCLNSLALSMNAFVTLGYGEIEAKGVARYFCVFEGIVGWFLLSIFSVSLISQILQ